jgi:peptidylprolyl isomerase
MSALASSRRLLTAGALALTLVLAGAACSSEDDGNVVTDVLEDDELPTQPANPADLESTTTLPQTCEAAPEEVTAEDKPVIEVPEGDPPTELQIEDLVEGSGREVASGDTVEVQYSGVAYSTGTEFDTSWDDLTPFPVTVGTGSVIDGWEEGLIGMKPGGRRQLIIPPDLAYGESGSGEDIGPNETLIFVIDAIEVCYPDEDAETTTTVAEGEGEGDETTTTVAEDETTTTAAEG